MKYEDFEKYILIIKKKQVLSRNLYDAFLHMDGDCSVLIDLESDILSLLKLVMNDEHEWISYYLYELDFGKKWKKGTIKTYGKDVKLKTIRDLYNLIK